MEHHSTDLRLTAINLDTHAAQMAVMKVISKHLDVPFRDLLAEFLEFKDEEMERLLIQLENADPAMAAALSATDDGSECEISPPTEAEQ
jgi:hypothetical protein